MLNQVKKKISMALWYDKNKKKMFKWWTNINFNCVEINNAHYLEMKYESSEQSSTLYTFLLIYFIATLCVQKKTSNQRISYRTDSWPNDLSMFTATAILWWGKEQPLRARLAWVGHLWQQSVSS